MTKKKGKVPRYSPLSRHKRERSKLLTPMHNLNIQQIDWERDLLPEHLWIELLSNTYIQREWQNLYEKFLDALDKCYPKDNIIFGFVSDFGLIPADKRKDFMENNEELVYRAFYRPMGRIITFYPEAPCYWLLQKKYLDIEKPVDLKDELGKLSKSVLRLIPGKDMHTGHIRVMPLSRALKHGKIYFKRGMEIAELLPKYPGECNEEEKYYVQSQARNMMHMFFQRDKTYSERKWPKYFWNRNMELVPCVPHAIEVKKETLLGEDDFKQLDKLINRNSQIAMDYLEEISLKHKYDLYDMERDEILLGLFSRLTRLYVLILSNPSLWSRDIAGILLRCSAETAITFIYLTTKGTNDEFRAFKAYGEGKEKLLMLHLQDTYPEKKSLEGMNSEGIAEEMGWGFSPELIDIELADWTDKSIRDLALDIKFEEIYRLVYDPTSSDVHGTWISLKKSNLVRCVQPLHRFHRMPQHIEPPLFANTVDAMEQIYSKCAEIGNQHLGFPEMKPKLEKVVPFLNKRKKTSA